MNTPLLKAAAEAVRRIVGDARADHAVILGSGWGDVMDTFPTLHDIPYTAIPGLGGTAIDGHEGRLRLVETPTGRLLIFQGRRHWYEGDGWEPVAAPVHIARSLGVTSLLLTNAAGAIRDDLNAGDLMAIEDHINAMGVNPLCGRHDPAWGPRFPDLSRIYDRPLGAALQAAADAESIPLANGVYIGTAGPGYETPAEIRMYRAWGADAVGMSTVPEAILAHAAGLRVAGLSCITNPAAGLATHPLNHDDVIRETRRALPRTRQLLHRFYSGTSNPQHPA